MSNRYYKKKTSTWVTYQPNKDKVKISDEALRLRYTSMIFNHYGNKCNCCGENNIMFLTVDHINNDGYKEKRSSGSRYTGRNLYKKIIDSGFPNTYQILCMNCNFGKHRNHGICPHNHR